MALIAAGSAGTRSESPQRVCSCSKPHLTKIGHLLPAYNPVGDIVRAPDLPQAKVNKCLITLSNAKHVVKTSNNVSFRGLAERRGRRAVQRGTTNNHLM